jgi:predicted GNAT superfamily acetyltransferase
MPGVGEIVFRDIESFAEYEACVELQRVVWAFPDVDIVPAAHLVVMHHYGGTCLGAFDGPKLVGFACGLVGFENHQAFHHSHMLAVLPEYRQRRIGEMLKWEQRERVLAQGMNLINWTFDPLQAGNANFNINRLGAVVRKYLVNVYGESVSPLHGGIPTDRFEAEWWIKSRRVLERHQGRAPKSPDLEKLPLVNPTVELGDLPRCPDGYRLDLDAFELLVAIPPALGLLLARDKNLALEWRLKIREIFLAYLNRDYWVVGFHRDGGRAFYRLRKNPAAAGAARGRPSGGRPKKRRAA